MWWRAGFAWSPTPVALRRESEDLNKSRAPATGDEGGHCRSNLRLRTGSMVPTGSSRVLREEAVKRRNQREDVDGDQQHLVLAAFPDEAAADRAARE